MRSRETGVEPLSRADASNVYIDAADQVNVFLLAGVLGAGGFVGADGEPDLVRLRADLGARLAADEGLRRLAQRVVGRGGGLGWEQSTPDLDRHVRSVAPVAGREGLAALCATLMTAPLPMDRPLWELLVVPGAGVDGPGSSCASTTPSRTARPGSAWSNGCSSALRTTVRPGVVRSMRLPRPDLPGRPAGGRVSGGCGGSRRSCDGRSRRPCCWVLSHPGAGCRSR